MKNMGAEIEYCNQRKSYIYLEEKTFAVGFVEESKLYGGKSSFKIDGIKNDLTILWRKAS